MTDNFSESATEVFQIAEAYAKENMNAAIEPAHILKALLHKDAGLVPFIEKTLDADYYYILEWADMRIKMAKKDSESSHTKGFSALTKAVLNEADNIRVSLRKESIISRLSTDIAKARRTRTSSNGGFRVLNI